MGYAVPPLAGLDKEREKTHPYTTKGGAPATATAAAKRKEGFFAALRMTTKSKGKGGRSGRPILGTRNGY